MNKDIIVIRPAKIYCDLSPQDRDGIFYRLKELFENSHIVVILFSENETNKTTFEIIKNE